jgi:(1->4)-alpha-D-glucan 1-alpha-D-glucosylmutase
MLATSTHDTKRSEDARARIAVLSEIPDLWKRHLARWTRLNRSKRLQLEGGLAPTRNDEYLLYQSLIGIWSPDEPMASLTERLQAYMIKAAREEKRSTSWMNPDAEYERALTQFVAQLLGDPDHNAFLRDFSAVAQVTNYFGAANSLAQALLKLTAPGVPDLYQGTELPSLALVDPDNRRPVDFDAAAAKLDEIEAAAGDDIAGAMLNGWQDGVNKLFVTWKLLQLRRQHPHLFSHGDYEPLQVAGAAKDHVLAFARRDGDTCVIVVLSRWAARLMNGELAAPIGAVWGDTAVSATPRCALGPMRNLFTGARVGPENGDVPTLRVAELFRALPFAVLVGGERE